MRSCYESTPPPARHHVGSQPSAARAPDVTFTEADVFTGLAGDDDDGPLPRHLRPGPQPHNAGLDPRWRYLMHQDKPATRGQLGRKLGRLCREVEEAVVKLAERDAKQEDRIAALEAEVAALKAERGEFAAAVRTLAARITELEARDTAHGRRPSSRGGRR